MYPPSPPQIQKPRSNHQYPLIALAVSAVGMILGFGLCGTGLLTQGTTYGGRIASIGLIVFCVSLAGLALSFIAFIISLIVSNARRKY